MLCAAALPLHYYFFTTLQLEAALPLQSFLWAWFLLYITALLQAAVAARAADCNILSVSHLPLLNAAWIRFWLPPRLVWRRQCQSWTGTPSSTTRHGLWLPPPGRQRTARGTAMLQKPLQQKPLPRLWLSQQSSMTTTATSDTRWKLQWSGICCRGDNSAINRRDIEKQCPNISRFHQRRFQEQRQNIRRW